MGLFSSDYKYFAHVGSSPLFEEDNRPETLKSNILQNAIHGEASAGTIIRFALGTDMFARGKSIMRYARSKYYHGFPETDQKTFFIPDTDLKDAIELDVGGTVTVGQVFYGPYGVEFFGRRFLKANYTNASHFNWGDPPTDPDWDETREEIEIPVVNPDTGAYYTAPNTPDYVKSGDVYTISFDYHDKDNILQTWDMLGTLDLTAYNTGDWIQAKYTTPAAPDSTEYWIYLIGSNDNPTLEAAISDQQLQMEYMPVIILMHDQVWYDEEANQELVDTTEGICRRLNLDPQEIKEDYIAQVEEDIASGDRPGKKKLDEWDFFIHFSVPIHTDVRGSREYLWNLFRNLEQTQTTSRATYVAAINNSEIPYSQLIITEGGENGYNVEYRWAYITSVTHNGVYQVNGENLKNNRMHSKVYQYGGTGDINDYMEGLIEVHGAGVEQPPIGIPKDDDDLHHYIVLTRQNNDNTYTQVLMMAPSMQYKVNTRDDPNKKGSYRYRYDTVELFPEDPEQESEFRWPVHYDTLEQVGVIRREEVLAEGLCATVYLVERQEVKWYQKGFFKWLIIIIAVILIVLSIVFPGFAAAAAFLLASALGVGVLGFYIIYAILMFAIGFIISMAGNLIGGTLGVAFAVIGAIVTMQAGLAGAPGGGGWGISTAGSNGWGSAFSLIQSTAPYIQGAQKIYSSYQMEQLQEDIAEWQEEAYAQQRELQNAMDLLGDGGGLDPSYLLNDVGGLQFVYEDSDSYFSRTLNANPGIIGYDLVNRFTDMALVLPEEPGDKNIIDSMIMDLAQQRGTA